MSCRGKRSSTPAVNIFAEQRKAPSSGELSELGEDRAFRFARWVRRFYARLPVQNSPLLCKSALALT